MWVEIYPHKYNKYKPGNMEIFKYVLSKLSVSGQRTYHEIFWNLILQAYKTIMTSFH